MLQTLRSQRVGDPVLKEIAGELETQAHTLFPSAIMKSEAFYGPFCPTTIHFSSHIELLSSTFIPEIKSIYSVKCILMSPLLGKLSLGHFLGQFNQSSFLSFAIPL